MAYRHVSVRNLTESYGSGRITQGARVEAAKAAGWQYWLDAVPVSHSVRELGMEVRKAYPFVRFKAITTDNLCRWECDSAPSQVWYATEIFIAVDTCPYVLAKIGYGQYISARRRSITGLGTLHRHYMVSARGIQNEKYSPTREQYSMRLTSNMKSAVKNTLANLLPYTIGEIATNEYADYYGKSTSISASKASQLPALLGCVTPEVLLNEVRALKAMGVTFTTSEFCRVADNCEEAAKVFNAERNKRVDAVLMHFVTHSDGVVAECAGVQNIRKNYMFKLDSSETYPLADVPQALQDKVAVLQTLLPGDHVDGVGMKVDEMLYWVEK